MNLDQKREPPKTRTYLW